MTAKHSGGDLRWEEQMPRQVFVTGVYGSGKTYFAERLSASLQIPHVSFDDVFDYASSESQSRAILRNLPSKFVIDAIPIDSNHSWKDFIDYESEHSVAVVCVYCPDKNVWLRRIRDKQIGRIVGGRSGLLRAMMTQYILGRRLWRQVSSWPGGFVKRIWGFVKTWVPKIKRAESFVADIDETKHLADYRRFFQANLPSMQGFKNIKYYDALAGEFTTHQVMLDRIGYKYFSLADYLDSAEKDYDCRYQDIEILDFVGYSESHRTWEQIERLVDWQHKHVVDLGCFHGYFSFKVEDEGATALGLDISALALKTARMINDLRGGNAEFREWKGGSEIPDCDVILCLNVLHHFPDQEAALLSMNARTVLFEVNRDQVPTIRDVFEIEKKIASHRRGRMILLCHSMRQDLAPSAAAGHP